MDQKPPAPHVKRFAGQGEDLTCEPSPAGQRAKAVAQTFSLACLADTRLMPKVQPYDTRFMTGTPEFAVKTNMTRTHPPPRPAPGHDTSTVCGVVPAASPHKGAYSRLPFFFGARWFSSA
ncbi:MAG: hypothetical protein Q8R06_15580 [Polaromonas sp.]|uniref:hypothetical protein n=1 Tax=Polaromonas sp. TaxID=1869339 RepID=UPI0027377A75|nr:hypothetical protein [Polaromonas sp.]MDP3798538.1 hypothetical protein [Polaromonas sp.]